MKLVTLFVPETQPPWLVHGPSVKADGSAGPSTHGSLGKRRSQNSRGPSKTEAGPKQPPEAGSGFCTGSFV